MIVDADRAGTVDCEAVIGEKITQVSLQSPAGSYSRSHKLVSHQEFIRLVEQLFLGSSTDAIPMVVNAPLLQQLVDNSEDTDQFFPLLIPISQIGGV